jgi:hypothetical protein
MIYHILQLLSPKDKLQLIAQQSGLEVIFSRNAINLFMIVRGLFSSDFCLADPLTTQ